MRKKIWVVVALCSFPAYGLNKDDEKALAHTQQLLTDDAALKAFTKGNPDAQNALGQVDKLTNGNTQQKAEVNAISTDVFNDMVKQNNGDSAAIQAKLQEALVHPDQFMKTLSPEQQARIRGLASEIDKQNAGPKK